jgi:hypothetical protein
VAKCMWFEVAEITNRAKVVDFESMARLWIRDNKLKVVNVFYTVVILCIWKVRNNLCFQGACWTGMKKLFERCVRLLRNWSLLNKPKAARANQNSVEHGSIVVIRRWALFRGSAGSSS